MKKYRGVFVVVCTIIILGWGGYLLLRGHHFDVLDPSGAVAKEERSILVFALLLLSTIVVPIFAMLGWFGWRYRSSAKSSYKPEWSENKLLETIWWGVPILVIGTLAVVTWVTSHTLDPYRPLASSVKPLEVQVIAMEWKWLFIYPDRGVASVNEFSAPVGVPIHFTLTADAPMNAFWIPALGTQIYTMNGMSSQVNLVADKAGDFVGKTTNISGKGYADMQFTLHARTQSEFDAWVSNGQKSHDMMDEAMYQKLAVPGTGEPKVYMLMDDHLYDMVIDKYMSGHASGASSAQPPMDMPGMGGM